MAALTAERSVNFRPGQNATYKMAAVKIYKGAAVCRNTSGYATNAADTAGLEFLGIATETVDNSGGSAGDTSITVTRQTYYPANDGSNAFAATDIGKVAYFSDNQTVATTSTNKVAAGIFRGLDPVTSKCWIEPLLLGVRTQVTLTSTDGVAAAASASLSNLAAEAEKIGDDVRAIHAALVLAGLLRG